MKLRDAVREKWLYQDENYITVTGPTTLEQNRRYVFTNSATFTLPDASSVDDGEVVRVTKLDSVSSATVETAGGNIVLRGETLTSYDFDFTGEIGFVSWSGDWHQVGWGKDGALISDATDEAITYAIALG